MQFSTVKLQEAYCMPCIKHLATGARETARRTKPYWRLGCSSQWGRIPEQFCSVGVLELLLHARAIGLDCKGRVEFFEVLDQHVVRFRDAAGQYMPQSIPTPA